MYPLERWTRTFLVCLCLWWSLLFSMQRQGAADSNEWADSVVSVIAASGGFSSLSMRGFASTKAPEASRRRRRRQGRSRTDEACEELRVLSIDSPTVHVVHKRPSQGHFCALTFDMSGSRRWRRLGPE